MIPVLIDKTDTFEIVRDQLAGILKAESDNQIILAKKAGNQNPDDWKLRVFTERANPWEQYDDESTDESPIVNIWYHDASFNLGSSNVMERQQSTGVFNIDCYGHAKSKNDGAGHLPGDQQAAFAVQRCMRLVRNILMAAEYTYLDLRGIVASRSFRSATVFQPPLDAKQVQHVVGARLACQVVYNEFSPQVAEVLLDTVGVSIKRAENGEILVEADYNYPIT